MRNKSKKRRIHLFFLLVFLSVAGLISFFRQGQTETDTGTDIAQYASGNMRVHFIDVGQADCILVQADGRNLLIDAGGNESEQLVVEYLRDQGVIYLDYVIASHAHVDHIGGMDAVIRNFPIGMFFLPKEKYDTESFQDVLIAVREKEITIHRPEFKEAYRLGEARFLFVTPDSEKQYEDVNDLSLGIRISNGAHSFLICGDISKKMEKQILKSRVYIRSDVMKLNHHGSSDANSWKFLKQVDPSFVVLTCGKSNDYGHPHRSVMKRIKKLDAGVFRTDRQGTIVFESDGEHLTSSKSPDEER
ncbi:ComEC/Rec2 family competence protein [Sellimonas caecigallum]|uniref:MBL fold metallo-hydrolase n=1 Tax=Sellimonas caecigallum TaxID=2592333 RepID=A0ABS7L7X6_9FIRM|nr:MBL fold metallo-hydrolase [Sellimonas caecigallum]